MIVKLIECLLGLKTTLSTFPCRASAVNWERVSFFSLFECGISVWLATHTRRTMTTSGKSAERKNRFTGPLSDRVPVSMSLTGARIGVR